MEIESQALKKFVQHWNSAAGEDSFGTNSDFNFLTDSDWLQDSAVIERINYHQGKWAINLVFANPKKTAFIIRFIRASISLQKAKWEAQFIRRTAAKDPRGTVTISPDLFGCPEN